MPRPRVQARPARMARIIADVHFGNTEELHADVRATGAQLAPAHLDDRRRPDQQGDEQDADPGAHQEGDRRVDGREDERGHRSRDGGSDQDPQRRTESLAIAVGAAASGTGVRH